MCEPLPVATNPNGSHTHTHDLATARRDDTRRPLGLHLGPLPLRGAQPDPTAIAAARAVSYVGAGTVEFIAEDDTFYFMEMNTRLQVEHPVTELITDQDLVEWQLRVAAGEPLPLTQNQLAIHGHAIEARVYAEDPTRDFLPSIGTLVHLRQPAETQHVRVDTGVRAGDAITSNYDPMIAKLIVWDVDRAAAVRRLTAALAAYEVVGVQTNLGILRAIALHPAFAAANLDTGFIACHPQVLEPPATQTPSLIWAAATLAVLEDERADRAQATASSADPWSPWAAADAWRMNGDAYQDLLLRDGDETITVRAHPLPDGGFKLAYPTSTVHVHATEDSAGMRLSLDGVQHRLCVVRDGAQRVVIHAGRNHIVYPIDPLAPPSQDHAGDDRVIAPIPARVARVLIKLGDRVAKGAPLLVLEAMKMEITLSAPIEGVVATIRHGADEMVEEGTELVTFVA